MAITGKQSINVGLPNESVGSDSLYTAWTKTNVNFDTLFANASNFNTFDAGDAIGVTSNATTGTVTITNTGVARLIAGTGVTLSGTTGNITISATGGGGNGGGTVTSVGISTSSSRLTVTGSPIVSSGTIALDLATSGVVPGSYAQANVTVDAYGRITSIANGTAGGTVTSVGLNPSTGISVSGGPITSAGNITVTNTGVTRLNAGTGIAVSSANGNVTVSSTNLSDGTVQSVGITSNTLAVTGGPITSIGAINLEVSTLPSLTVAASSGESKVFVGNDGDYYGTDGFLIGERLNAPFSAQFGSGATDCYIQSFDSTTGTDFEFKIQKSYTTGEAAEITYGPKLYFQKSGIKPGSGDNKTGEIEWRHTSSTDYYTGAIESWVTDSVNAGELRFLVGKPGGTRETNPILTLTGSAPGDKSNANIAGNLNVTGGIAATETMTVPVYTIATIPGAGAVGQLIAISDSTPGGKMAYWDTTNSRWSYVSDDSAV